jgi:hypothetical protein
VGDSTLHDLLEELAAGATAGRAVGEPGADLWRAGRRHARVRRLGTVVIAAAAVLALAATGAITWHHTRYPAPASTPSGAGHLPSRLYPQVSPHLPGTASAGPLGQLAALIQADRQGWGGKHHGFVGVSATTGTYRFLDLPGLVQADAHVSSPLLAPDGEHVFYWSNDGTIAGAAGESDRAANVAGFAVYDTTTGTVVQHPIATVHGLAPEDGEAWLDATHVLLTYGQVMGGADDVVASSSSDHYASYIWDIGTGTVTQARGVPYAAQVLGSDRSGQVVMEDNRTLLVDPATGAKAAYRSHWGDIGQIGSYRVALTARGRAAYAGPYRNAKGRLIQGVPGQLMVIGPHDRTPTLVPIPDQDTFGVAGWLDASHVAAVLCHGNTALMSRRRGDPSVRTAEAISSVDVRTGVTTDLVRFVVSAGPFDDDECGDGDAQVATTLLTSPTRDFPPPPRPWSPWVPTGLGGGIALAAGLGLWAWRRRRAHL